MLHIFELGDRTSKLSRMMRSLNYKFEPESPGDFYRCSGTTKTIMSTP